MRYRGKDRDFHAFLHGANEVHAQMTDDQIIHAAKSELKQIGAKARALVYEASDLLVSKGMAKPESLSYAAMLVLSPSIGALALVAGRQCPSEEQSTALIKSIWSEVFNLPPRVEG